MKRKSRIIRVDAEFARKLEELAKKNDMQITEASREFAKEMNKKKKRKEAIF